MQAHPKVRDAAAVADRFNLDPVAVYAEPDPLKAHLRLAALNLLQDEEQAAHRRAEAEAERTRKRGR